MKRQVNRTLLKKLMKEKGTECVEEKGVSISTLKKLAYNDYDSELKDITVEAICIAYEIPEAKLFPSAKGKGPNGGDAA